MMRWVKVAGVAVLIWAVAGGVIYWSRAARPTAQSVTAYMDAHPLGGLGSGERGRIIQEAAEQLNRLDFKEREELRKLRRDREFFAQLTQEERKKFLELTLPQGFRELMKALNAMSPTQRKQIVNRAMRNVERENPELADRFTESDMAKIVSSGLEAFYEDANADVKLEFSPVIERLQRATQGLR